MSNIIVAKSVVTLIGKGERTLGESADALVALAPEGWNHKERGAVADFLRQHVEEGQRTVGPKGDQRTTDYGRGFKSLEAAVKSRLDKRDETVKPVVLRASLSGEGGGSVTIDPKVSPDLYAALVAMIQGDDETGEE